MGQLELQNLTKCFGTGDESILAVDDVSLTVDDGDFLVLVGPSGCGKSTILRSNAGLEGITSGDIRLNGESIVEKKPKNRDIAMVFQNYALYPHMTAFDNIAFGLRMAGNLPEDEIRTKVEKAAQMMDIEEHLDQRPNELSGGQQQRVALGRAIVREPEVFLMDEPLSNLDAKLRTQMRAELQDLHNTLDVTTIYVTHDQTEAMTMGDQIAVLNDGQLQQIGTPLECYHQPANQFVAEFIGSPSMNILDVELRDGTLIGEEFTLKLSTDYAEQLDGYSGPLSLGIRPEDVELANETVTAESISADVNVVEPMGDETVLYLQVGSESVVASVEGGTLLSADDEIELTFPEERIHLFDEITGEALLTRRTSDEALARST